MSLQICQDNLQIFHKGSKHISVNTIQISVESKTLVFQENSEIQAFEKSLLLNTLKSYWTLDFKGKYF